jgi:DNA polymerase-3 subunit gamma/tau
MTLLRMLSFQPQAVNVNLGQPPVKKPQADSKSVSAMAAEHATVESTPPANSPKTTINRITESVSQTIAKPPSEIAPLEINEVQVEQTSDSLAVNEPEITVSERSVPESVEQLVNLTTANWTALIAQLKLSAFARQLADHCAFIRTDNQKIYLSVAPELQHLTNEKSVAKLQAAVSKQLDVEVILVFTEATDTENVPTLAAERAQQAAELHQNAVDAIHNDPVVEQIKNAFNARIIDTTIKPL